MWKEEDGCLCKTYVFKDFLEAFAFMKHVALVAEKLQHHPDWRNIWNRVEIKLSTHDMGNVVTEKDRKLAAAIDSIYVSGKR